MCQRHNRAIKVLGLASVFFLIGQVSQAKVFSDVGVLLVFMVDSFHGGHFFDLTSAYPLSVTEALRVALHNRLFLSRAICYPAAANI